MAVLIGQLTSCNPEHVINPFKTQLITDYCTNSVFKCDWLNGKLKEIKTQVFDFSGHSSVQIGFDLYAISGEDLTVTRIENLLSKCKEIETTALATYNKHR